MAVGDFNGDAPAVALWVCSAGYGLIPCNASIASYAATFAPNHPDSVTRAEDNGHSERARRDWWDPLTEWHGPIKGAPRSIHELACEHRESTLLVAASTHYLDTAAILSYKAEWKVLSSDGDLLAKRNRRACVSWVQRGGGWVVACVQDMVIGEE